MQMPGMTMPAPPKNSPPNEPATKQPAVPTGHEGMAMPMQPASAAHGGATMAMTGAFGPYPMQRESSGTALRGRTISATQSRETMRPAKNAAQSALMSAAVE